jgi:hypothetical protein
MRCEYKLPDGSQCGAPADQWDIWGYGEPAPRFYYCREHAARFGFCLSCGAFVGGTEDFLRTGQEGLCFDCYWTEQQEIERVFYDDDDDDDWEGK